MAENPAEIPGKSKKSEFAVSQIIIKHFGCVQNVALKLSPIHALTGPNDSGKSTILRAVRTAMQLQEGRFTGGFPEVHRDISCSPFHPGLHKNAEIEVRSFPDDIIIPNRIAKYNVRISENENIEEKMWFVGEPNSKVIETLKRRIWDIPIGTRNSTPNQMPKAPRMIRLDPDSLRMPGKLIPSSKHIEMGNEKGIGIASIYDALMNKTVRGFLKITDQLQNLFPTISSLSLKNIEVSDDGIAKILELELKDGTRVPAQFMSEGVLYYLAFAALEYIEPASIILVEEPENGLHPSRIKDIMNILREISITTQVLIATHSPLVINEMKDDEVTMVWRDDKQGTMAMPLNETANFKERSKVYELGELWLSYADGINEKQLREGPQK